MPFQHYAEGQSALIFDREYDYASSPLGIEVPISLSLSHHSLEIVAKIDTGAANCIFSREVGEQLGIEIEAGVMQQFSTATGRFTAYGHSVRLQCLGIDVDANVYFAADPAFHRNVLGRGGWLEQIRLAIIDYDRKLFISPYSQP